MPARTTTRKKPNYAFEDVRFETFGNSWKFGTESTVSAERLAAAGWYRINADSQDDEAVCFASGKSLWGWEENDDPFEEHGNHCKKVYCRWGFLQETDARLSTFKDTKWPHTLRSAHEHHPKHLSAAGFYSFPTSAQPDRIRCHYCGLQTSGLGKGGQHEGVDAWTLHLQGLIECVKELKQQEMEEKAKQQKGKKKPKRGQQADTSAMDTEVTWSDVQSMCKHVADKAEEALGSDVLKLMFRTDSEDLSEPAAETEPEKFAYEEPETTDVTEEAAAKKPAEHAESTKEEKPKAKTVAKKRTAPAAKKTVAKGTKKGGRGGSSAVAAAAKNKKKSSAVDQEGEEPRPERQEDEDKNKEHAVEEQKKQDTLALVPKPEQKQTVTAITTGEGAKTLEHSSEAVTEVEEAEEDDATPRDDYPSGTVEAVLRAAFENRLEAIERYFAEQREDFLQRANEAAAQLPSANSVGP
eukprot:Clim_evm62s214 gene=Clim_evmTU62s214